MNKNFLSLEPESKQQKENNANLTQMNLCTCNNPHSEIQEVTFKSFSWYRL